MNDAHKMLLERIDCGMLNKLPITEIDDMAVAIDEENIVLGFPGLVVNLNIVALEKINELVGRRNK
ncbi:MAG: hypothetical protein WC338_08045 [Candidatus Ratteibacteria bacterium]|jgi:hypothetical protein